MYKVCCVSVSHLFLVPFEIREEDKTNLLVWIFKHYPLTLCVLLQDVVNPLGGEREVKTWFRSHNRSSCCTRGGTFQDTDLHTKTLFLNVGQSDGLIVLPCLFHQETLLTLVFLQMLLGGWTHNSSLDLCKPKNTSYSASLSRSTTIVFILADCTIEVRGRLESVRAVDIVLHLQLQPG